MFIRSDSKIFGGMRTWAWVVVVLLDDMPGSNFRDM